MKWIKACQCNGDCCYYVAELGDGTVGVAVGSDQAGVEGSPVAAGSVEEFREFRDAMKAGKFDHI